MVEIPNVVSRVESVESRGGNTIVKVRVSGPKGVTGISRCLRARARALAAVGVLPSVSDSLEDITVGELKALTSQVDKTTERTSSRIKVDTIHTVKVNRD